MTNADQGVTINQEVLQHLEAINGQVRKVSEVMNEIAAASEQQSQGVEQISSAIANMNGLTQQVAANAEESASAAEELSAQASEMQGLVGQFQLASSARGGGGRGSRSLSSAPGRRPAQTKG